jgi:LPS sulfotransferase NodH
MNSEKMKKIIAVLSIPRTGSTLLMVQLNSVFTGIRNLSELFNMKQTSNLVASLRNDERRKLENLLGIGLDNEELIDQLTQDPVDFITKLNQSIDEVIMFKIQPLQVNFSQILRILAIPEIEVIVLERRNYLEEYVSLLKLIKYDANHNQETDFLKVDIDFESFVEHTAFSQAWYQGIRDYCRFLNKNFLEISYEKHLVKISEERFMPVFAEWFNSVGFELKRRRWVKPFYFKMNNSPIQHSIKNWKEVETRLIKYQDFFNKKK